MPVAAAKRKSRFKPKVIGTGQVRMRKGSQLEIGRLVLLDQPRGVDLKSALTDIQLSMTIEGANTLTITVNDYKRNLMNSDFSKTATRLKFDNLAYRLTKVDKGGDNLTLTFEEEAVFVLRQMTNPDESKPFKRLRKRVTRAEFVRMLVREPDKPKKPKGKKRPLGHPQQLGDDRFNRPSYYHIPFWSPEIYNKQPKAAETSSFMRRLTPLQAAIAAPLVSASAAVSWEAKISEGNLTVKGARANAQQARMMSLIVSIGREKGANLESVKGAMATAIQESGLDPKASGGGGAWIGLFQQTPPYWGTYAEVSDPEYAIAKFYSVYLPYRRKGEDWLTASHHTQVSVNPEGPAQWEDEALKNSEYFWGRQKGSGSGGGSSADSTDGTESETRRKDYEFVRDKNENSWDCAGRLADVVRWRRFMRLGVFWYVSEDWLMHQPTTFKFREFSPGVHAIDFSWDARRGTMPMSSFKASAAEATVSFEARRYGVLPGDTIELVNVGVGSGKWIATEVNKTLISPLAEVSLKRFQKKLPEPPRETETISVNNEETSTSNGSGGAQDAQAMVKWAKGTLRCPRGRSASCCAGRVTSATPQATLGARSGSRTASSTSPNWGFRRRLVSPVHGSTRAVATKSARTTWSPATSWSSIGVMAASLITLLCLSAVAM